MPGAGTGLIMSFSVCQLITEQTEAKRKQVPGTEKSTLRTFSVFAAFVKARFARHRSKVTMPLMKCAPFCKSEPQF